MRMRLYGAALAALVAASTPAHALKIVLVDTGGVKGSPAGAGFSAAARYWESVITNDVTLRLNVGFEDLGPNVLGATGSTLTTRGVQFVQNRIDAQRSSSAVDSTIHAVGRAPLTPGQLGIGALDVVTPGYVDPVDQLGIDNAGAVLDTDGSFNNSVIALSTANAKAIGYVFDPLQADANITFSSTFPFDFNPKDGIDTGAYDFIGVAIHEIGHALGFLSGADDYDFLGCPNGPGCAAFADYPVNDDWWGYTLDLYRYGRSFDGQARLDWRPGVESYFSIDGGASDVGRLAEGSFHGAAGDQASHWFAPTQSPFCSGLQGIMNPYICSRTPAIVTSKDLTVMDAIGWNLTDEAQNANYVLPTSALAYVPEPATWAMMIVGFGLVGSTMRRRRPAVSA